MTCRMIIHASVIIQSEKNERINVSLIVDGADCIGRYSYEYLNCRSLACVDEEKIDDSCMYMAWSMR